MVAERQLSRKTFDSSLCSLVIEGEPCSKANSRRLVHIKGRMVPIKSTREELFTEDLIVCMKIFYKTLRPDLDESLVLDLMQGRIYKNDRSIKLKYIEHGLDRESPSTLIVVAPLEMKEEAISRFSELLENY